MGRYLCVANQKGGVGKTTTAVNLAVGLARTGRPTLLVDLDPQCNATSSLGGQPAERHPLVVQRSVSEVVCRTECPGLDLLPGCHRSDDLARLVGTEEDRGPDEMGQYLAAETRDYHFVLYDCPPSLGRLTEAALMASTEVLMPIQCEYFAMEGLTQMIQVIKRVMNQRSSRLQFGGILLTMYDHLLDLTREVDQEVREFFGEIVFDTVIPRDVAVCEAPSHQLSVIDYAPRTRGARAYIELCMEVLERE